MAFPADIYTQIDVTGTTSLATDDHSARHNEIGAEIVSIETTLGTNSGTSVLKNFIAGDMAARVNNETFSVSKMLGGTIGTAIIGTSYIVGGTLSSSVGTLNNMVLGTPVITGGSIGVNGTTVALTVGAGLVPTSNVYSDTAGGTIIINAQAGNVARIVFGTTAGNRTIGTPNNPTSDQSLTIAIKSSGSANGTIVWDTGAFRFSDAGTPAIGTASTWNYYAWRYNGTDSKWDAMGQSSNII